MPEVVHRYSVEKNDKTGLIISSKRPNSFWAICPCFWNNHLFPRTYLEGLHNCQWNLLSKFLQQVSTCLTYLLALYHHHLTFCCQVQAPPLLPTPKISEFFAEFTFSFMHKGTKEKIMKKKHSGGCCCQKGRVGIIGVAYIEPLI